MGYREYEQLNLPEIDRELLDKWSRQDLFRLSLEQSNNKPKWIFYEGPPSANGMPGIHHVLSRTIKDIFCRYKTMQGFHVDRKGGWDTHGLPVELQVEKKLGITKEEIGKSISVADYNKACKEDVLKYKDIWDDLTAKMGYWVDLDNPYITYENEYIESLWYLLKSLYEKGLLYQGLTIQPYSPAAGTGLSSHELNMPGAYKSVKDTSAVAQFKLIKESYAHLTTLNTQNLEVFALAWTTTPWTLPSNTALAVGKNIDYELVKTFNPYTGIEQVAILAKDRLNQYFSNEVAYDHFKIGEKKIPFQSLGSIKGAELAEIKYEQLMPYAQPQDGEAFKIIIGDFVSTEDGTGIVHIAPSFGSDDFKVAKQNGIGSLNLVDDRGRFTDEVTDFASEYVKEAYLSDEEKELERIKQGRDKYLSVDERISIKLKAENRAFKVEKYEHNYPHCWRTDKPILYYPLKSWFIKTTAVKNRLIELNKTIHWMPESTGTGRFGNWLENLVDWNLSRSRYWGTPLPIWKNDSYTKCIGSIEELQTEAKKALNAGFTQNAQYFDADGKINIELHKPYVDDIVLIDDAGIAMYREPDLIDVWFDSGAMPYAQWHYPFNQTSENGTKTSLESVFPADFIAEGVDQTRGWFFTLHAISVMLFDSVAFKNVIANGLVLDKEGNKMSKRLGNVVDPFSTISKYGADAVRWYMLSNAAPWDNLKFDVDGIDEVKRKFFGTLFNVYSFYALYANVDQFESDNNEPDLTNTSEIDRWILSLLHSLIAEVSEAMESFEPMRATRAIQDFVSEHLSNWYVRLSRRRFWKDEMSEDKLTAYKTLSHCLHTVAKLIAPFAPFYAEKLFLDLHPNGHKISVHLEEFPKANQTFIDTELERRMEMAQEISSLVLSIRKKANIRVRQPLQKILVPYYGQAFEQRLDKVKNLILSEVNVKSIEILNAQTLQLKKRVKPNFKTLGKKAGKNMKALAELIANLTDDQLNLFEQNKQLLVSVNEFKVLLEADDLEINYEDIPGWQVASNGTILVALDIELNQSLEDEGLARELINRIQNLRKDKMFEVTDQVNITLYQLQQEWQRAFSSFVDYICNETLTKSFDMSDAPAPDGADEIELLGKILKVNITKQHQ